MGPAADPLTPREEEATMKYRRLGSTELPVSVIGFWPAEIGPGAPQPTPDDTIVFHVYLATDDATPPIEELGVTGR
jgi:hypothetical protein